jgi:hypothetical protein
MTSRRNYDQQTGRSTVDLRKLSFRKGVIGEDLDDCPDCSWHDTTEGRMITKYCKPCEDSVDLIIDFLKAHTWRPSNAE